MSTFNTDQYRDLSRFFQFNIGKLGGSSTTQYNIDSVMENTVKPILNWFVILSAVAAVAIIIYSAYTLITSGGDQEKISKGQKGLTAAIVGMVIVFVARIFIIFVLETLGLE